MVVLENINRHLAEGSPPEVAAREGAEEVALPVLASTLTTIIVFFPVMFLFGVAKYLFSALALAVVLSMIASYVVAMSIIPIYCARFLNAEEARELEAVMEGTEETAERRVFRDLQPLLRTIRPLVRTSTRARA